MFGNTKKIFRWALGKCRLKQILWVPKSLKGGPSFDNMAQQNEFKDFDKVQNKNVDYAGCGGDGKKSLKIPVPPCFCS